MKTEDARHAAHLALPEIGAKGQQRLAECRVLIVGVGGLGCPAALQLAATGVGTLTLVDPDKVDASNLARQTLYGEVDCGRYKVEVAREQLLRNNPRVRIDARRESISPRNARELVRAHDVVLDCSDNYATRYVTNDACVMEGRPLVYAAIHRFEGRIAVFAGDDAPCYRCLYPNPPEGEECACSEAGVLGMVPAVMGAMQAAEAIKLLLGIGNALGGRMLFADLLAMSFQEMLLRRDPDCLMCGDIARSHRVPAIPASPRNRSVATVESITAPELLDALASGESFQFIDLRPHARDESEPLPGAIRCLAGELDAVTSRLDSERPTVVYCRAGMRSRWAAEALARGKMRRVMHLTGGLEALERARRSRSAPVELEA